MKTQECLRKSLRCWQSWENGECEPCEKTGERLTVTGMGGVEGEG